jgi:hypothetical protein
MITIPSQSIAGNVKQFLVASGVIGAQYGIEAVAVLTDGQVWVDHITVYITDCGANIPSIAGGMLLSTMGPIAISNTLYYDATASQEIFSLYLADMFGHYGTLVDSNVLVYVGGARKTPYVDYNVNVRNNQIVFTSPIAAGVTVGFDILTPEPPPPIYPPPVLITGGVIATTLYYIASNGQTVFPLSTPDRFGHTGNIATATGNVLVYANGFRKEPIDDYTISLGANTITFTSPLTAGTDVGFDLVTSPPPVPVIPPPILLDSAIIATTLYYTGIGGQTIFNLGTPDEFGNVGELTVDQVNVYRSGNRLTFTDGYTLNIPGNTVTLAFPAGAGEPIVIELTTPPPPPPTLGGTIPRMESLTIATMNVFPALAYAPDGAMLMLFVNGQAFFPPTSFTVSGTAITWVSTLFSVPPGAAVIAVYTHA